MLNISRLLLIFSSLVLVHCNLFDNSIKGRLDLPGSPPVGPPNALNIDLSLCSQTPPEALPYSCDVSTTANYTLAEKTNQTVPYALASQIIFDLINNTCLGLSVNSSGRLEGELLNSVSETCSFELQVSLGELSVSELFTLTVAPSLTFSFSQENVFLQEGQSSASVNLNLSAPAPYDTYIDFDIYGDQNAVVSGISYVNKRIHILKGQISVNLELSVTNNTQTDSKVFQQVRITTGSTQVLPGLSINTYDSLTNPHSFEFISNGLYHNSCGIDNDELFCWGDRSSGQVGDGTIGGESINSPLRIGASMTVWTAISSGYFYTCGIADAGTLYCWGDDSYGTLGNGSGSSSTFGSPQSIGILVNWSSISAGKEHACGIESGELYCWGRDNYGKIGNGSILTSQVDLPTKIGILNNWNVVAAGDRHSCGIESGNLYCWGYDYSGQVGNGSLTSTQVDEPLLISSSGTWTTVSSGVSRSCGIDSGALFCWGKNIGLVGSTNSEPQQIGNLDNWTWISIGTNHSCGINSGNAFCWGSNTDGQLGTGDEPTNATSIPRLINGSHIWTKISAGYRHTCGTNDTGSYCWGSNVDGMTGIGRATLTTLITAEQVGTKQTWAKVSGGWNHTCGINSGRLYCWGYNRSSEAEDLGGTILPSENPIQVGLAQQWSDIAAGSQHSCGIENGKLFCWGGNPVGQLGIDENVSQYVGSVSQVGAMENWQQVATGKAHTCAIESGNLFCFGTDYYSQVGNGATTNSNVPLPIQIGNDQLWTQVSAGDSHTCAILAGKLYCWGRDTYGQIGNGDLLTSDITSPVQIGSASTWTWVSAGKYHSCGINNDELYCWGKDAGGQIGNGSIATANVTEPFKITTPSLWSQVTAGADHTCGIASNKVYCWGQDSYGQIGDGEDAASTKHIPVQIAGDLNFSSVAAGLYHNCGVTGGKLYCWGQNFSYQTGTNSSFLNAPFLILE